MDELGNCRGITLLNTIFKLLTSVLNRTIMDHIQTLLPEEQNGFRPERNEAGNRPVAVVRDKLSKRRVVTFDLMKAFDSRDRGLAIRKLDNQFGGKRLDPATYPNILQFNFIKVFDS